MIEKTKISPNDKELERVILGALLLSAENLPKIAPILKDEYFYQKENQIVYRAIKSIWTRSEVIDILTIMITKARTKDFYFTGRTKVLLLL